MCRLFGLYANRLVDVGFSFYKSPKESFVRLSYDNSSGWGIAWFDDEWHIYKEPQPLYLSDKAKVLVEKRVRGRIIVSHVRLASVGRESLENTHPWLYRGWVFAHNGTINRKALLKLLRREYQDFEGDTDSETFFHLIVQEIEDLSNPVEGIISAIKKNVSKGVVFSSLNFIASDGKRLYALRYATKRLSYYTLYYLDRPREGLELRKLSKETQQLILTKLAHGEKAVVIASEPMSDEPYWKPIPNKHLVIISPNLNVELIPIKT